MIPNANVVTSSFDRITGTPLTPSTQPYNRFRIQTTGANVIQGQVNKLSITELMFPYDIPTVIKNVNDRITILERTFPPSGLPSVTSQYDIQIAPGFYTAAEMVAAITSGISSGGSLTCSLNTTNNCISFNNTATWNSGSSNKVYEILPSGPSSTAGSGLTDKSFFNKPTLLFNLGFRNLYADKPLAISTDTYYHPISLVPYQMPSSLISQYCPNGGYQAITGASYSGAYTQYIDVVSPSLTQAQYVRDSTTSQNTVKKDVIARIYVCDNVSLATSNQIGSRPFVIYRIFPCPKVMKWTVDRSLDAIQLELYDQFGQPLPIPTNLSTGSGLPPNFATEISSGVRDFSITLHVHEHDETMEPNVGYRY